MPDYEASLFDPPAPAARVRLISPGTAGTVSDVLLLLDGPQLHWSEHPADA